MSWAEAIRRILEADTFDMVELAKLSGVSPENFYVGMDFTGVNLRGQNLAGLNLSGASLAGALLDDQTKIDERFDPRSIALSGRRQISIPLNLYVCVRMHEATLGYSYTGWAIKNVLEKAYREVVQNRSREWIDAYEASSSIRGIVSQTGGRRFDLKLNMFQYQEILAAYDDLDSSSKALKLALFSGIMRNWNVRPELAARAPSILDLLRSLPLQHQAKNILKIYEGLWREA